MTAAPIATGVRRCQDLPALEDEGGDAVDLSLSLWSLSSVDEGGGALLSPLCVMSLLQVSICTSRPLFIEHISMYSCR